MATIIKIKRSSGTSTPNLGQGELGYSWGTGTYVDAQSATVTSYGKMFLGTGTETGGIAANIEVIGGKYFTEMLDHGHGTITANSAAIVDSAKKVNEWNVDNISLDLNTISTTNSNGDLNIDTNGSGDVNIIGSSTSGTNLFNITDGTTTRFSVDSFSGATTISSNTLTTAEELLNISSTWNNGTATFYGIKFDVTNTASGANSKLIDLQVGGSTKFNVDTSGNVYLAGNISAGTSTSTTMVDNTASAYVIKEGASNNYLKFDTTDGSEAITFGNSLTSITNIIEDNFATAFVVKEGTNNYLVVDTTNAAETVTFGTGNVVITNDLAVNGGDITTSSSTFNIAASATTLTLGNTGTGARTVNIGTAATAGASTLTFGGAVSGNIFKVSGTAAGTTNLTSDVTTGVINLYTGITTGTANIATGGASTVNLGGAAGSVNIGTTTGNSTLTIRGNGTGGTASIATNVTTGSVNVFTAVTTGTINYGSATTRHDFGSVNIQGNVISSDVVGATQLILDPFPTGGDSAGEVLIRGNLTVAGTTTTVNSTEVSVNDPIFTLGDAVSTKMVTSNASGGATSLVIDSPSGIVEGSSITGTNVAASTTITNIRTRFYTSAQMAGTQTAGTTVIYTYNTSTTTYEAIGVYVSKGTNYLEVDLNSNIALREDDYYVGLELRDANSGTPNNVTIARDSANNKVFTTGATLTLSLGLTSGITAPQEVTISQGADDNMDRGVQFKYYNGSLKTGFFGYDESGVIEDVTTYYFTYIPDSTNTNNVFSGTIGSAYFKTVKVNDGITNGISFYDTYKRLTSTAAAGTSDATTSNQILTVNGSGVPVWTTTLDGGTY